VGDENVSISSLLTAILLSFIGFLFDMKNPSTILKVESSKYL